MLAGTGHGKTTWLAGQLLKDIEKVKRGEASVIVIDSQVNELEEGKISLIPQLMRLDMRCEDRPIRVGDRVQVTLGGYDMVKGGTRVREILQQEGIVFVDGSDSGVPIADCYSLEPKDSRVVIVDPSDLRFPVALNLFDAGITPDMDEAEQYTVLEGAIGMFQFLAGSLLDHEMTPRQATLFSYIAELLIVNVPNATIHDFRNLLDPKRAAPYEKFWVKAAPETKDFFENEFNSNGEARKTCEQVLARLRPILRNRVFANMFSSPKSKINLLEEINAGKLILVSCNKDFLATPEAVKLFGRFWISQINQAAIRRSKSKKKTPTFVYIDECQDYLAGGDPKVENILAQARKQNIGLTLIHHYVGQLKSDTLAEALDANTSTKIVGTLSINDQGRLPKMMHSTPDFLRSVIPKKTFGFYVKGLTPTAVAMSFPNVQIEPELSDDQLSVIIQSNRKKYCYTPKVHTEHIVTPPKEPDEDPDEEVAAKAY